MSIHCEKGCDHLKKALQDVINAWEVLPGGMYRPRQVQDWLVGDMKPAIDALRSLLRGA